jgi:hypothetical protein
MSLFQPSQTAHSAIIIIFSNPSLYAGRSFLKCEGSNIFFFLNSLWEPVALSALSEMMVLAKEV